MSTRRMVVITPDMYRSYLNNNSYSGASGDDYCPCCKEIGTLTGLGNFSENEHSHGLHWNNHIVCGGCGAEWDDLVRYDSETGEHYLVTFYNLTLPIQNSLAYLDDEIISV